jgi:hypothetical protein
MLADVTLAAGSHRNRTAGMCALEAVAWMAGESHSDEPRCVSPLLASFVRFWNDCGSTHDRHALKPFLESLVNTRDGMDALRAAAAGRWIIEIAVPAWLAAAGHGRSAQSLASMAGRMGEVGLHELRAARMLREELSREFRAEVDRTGSQPAPITSFEAAAWSAIAGRYSGRPAPVWYLLVESAWGAGWAAKRLCHLRDPTSARTIDAVLRDRSLDCLERLIALEPPV